MLRVRWGEITEIISDLPEQQTVIVRVDGKEERGVVYPDLTGRVSPGDEVWVNTTALHLSLGSGGYHFIMGIRGREERDLSGPGHIMKLRYTPWQLQVLSAEEEEAPHREKIEGFASLEGAPVIVGALHSMIAPAILAFYELATKPMRIVYIMTDGAALPIHFSRTVRELKERDLIQMTITSGHAFGGDLESVNIYSALVSAKAVGQADLVLVAMGPGIVGTGTRYGFSGIEQAYILEAVERLGGTAIAIPRVSFADPRLRHRGLSHHSRTVLSSLTYARSLIGIPYWNDDRDQVLAKQIREDGLEKKHQLLSVVAPPVRRMMEDHQIELHSMGRSFTTDPSFFEAAAASGVVAAYHHQGRIALLPQWESREQED